jgi:hypothetical protein
MGRRSQPLQGVMGKGQLLQGAMGKGQLLQLKLKPPHLLLEM